jgi:hypothetical protein
MTAAGRKAAQLFQLQPDRDQFLYRVQVGLFPHLDDDRAQRALALGVEERMLAFGVQGAGVDGGSGLDGEIERDLEEPVPGRDPADGPGLERHLAQPGLAVVVIAPLVGQGGIVGGQRGHEGVPGGLGAAELAGQDGVGGELVGIVQGRSMHRVIIHLKRKKVKGKSEENGHWVMGYG